MHDSEDPLPEELLRRVQAHDPIQADRIPRGNVRIRLESDVEDDALSEDRGPREVRRAEPPEQWKGRAREAGPVHRPHEDVRDSMGVQERRHVRGILHEVEGLRFLAVQVQHRVGDPQAAVVVVDAVLQGGNPLAWQEIVVEPLPCAGVGSVGGFQVGPKVDSRFVEVPEVIARPVVRAEEIRVAAEADHDREDEEARQHDDRHSTDGLRRDSRGSRPRVDGRPVAERPEGGEGRARHRDRGEGNQQPRVPDERDGSGEDCREDDEIEAGQLSLSANLCPGQDEERRDGEGEAQRREGRMGAELEEEVPV